MHQTFSATYLQLLFRRIYSSHESTVIPMHYFTASFVEAKKHSNDIANRTPNGGNYRL